MKRRVFLAVLAAVPFLRRWAKAAPTRTPSAITKPPMYGPSLSGWIPIASPPTVTVTMPGGARFTGERLPDGWVRMRDPWSPTGYVDMRQCGSGVDVRWGSREGYFEQAEIVLT